MPLESYLGRALFSAEWMGSSANCVRKQMCVDRISLFDGSVAEMFVKSGFVSGWICPILHDYIGDLNVLRV